MNIPRFIPIVALALLPVLAARATEPAKPPTYADVHAIFAKNCLSCHDSKEADGELVLETHESLMKGGETGKAIVPGKSGESLLVTSIERTRKPLMPPPKKGERLSDAEIKTIRAWIDAGALPGDSSIAKATPPAVVVLPKIAARAKTRPSVNALAISPDGKFYAVGLPGVVELRSIDTRAVVKKFEGHKGNVNDLAFTADGKRLAAAAGEPGVAGEVRIWNVDTGRMVRKIDAHADAVYSVAISPDGSTLATGSYDQLIKLWELSGRSPGNELLTLKGHNGCVFDLAFRPDGKVLASASADRTMKLWSVANGERLDTRPESLKDLYAVAFSPDGSRVFAAGVDNRIRVWSVSADAREGSNKLLQSVFAHEGAVLRLAFSPDGKTLASSSDNGTVKLWNPADVTIRKALPQQPDWPTALALTNTTLLVGRLDGSIEAYDVNTGDVAPPPKPDITAAEPRGVQRGAETKLKLTGQNLGGVTAVKSSDPAVTLRLENDSATKDAIWIYAETPKDLAAPEVKITASGPGGESNAFKLFVDSFPQFAEHEPDDSPAQATPLPTLPAAVWGSLAKPGDADHYAFNATAGEPLVIEVAAKRLGGKADAVLTLFDPAGNVVASNNDAEGSPDPLLTFTPPADGRYVVKVHDLMIASSPNEHFYRLTVGNFPLVTGVFPLGAPAGTETKLKLLGFNLPAGASLTVKPDAKMTDGEAEAAIDRISFPRVRREPKVLVSSLPTSIESEPNDKPEQATKLAAPGIADGRIMPNSDRPGEGDVDVYRFDARKDQTWIIETVAARRGSPADTKIEVLDTSGKPVPRVLLRAVRDSYFEFRPVPPDGTTARLKSWEEMELNQYLYMKGEVVRLFLAPRGPDSTWDFYELNGKRRCYFDTSAASHALDEACYIVEPLPPGSTPPPNGLPTFPLNYVNDDDSERKLGSDSRLTFVAPADGAYLVRVSDARSIGSERHTYRLVVREAKPDFSVTVAADSMAVPPGSGVGFTVKADRVDNFDGDITLDVADLPAGFTASSPIVIQAGHVEARGTIHAAADAAGGIGQYFDKMALTATSTIRGRTLTKRVPNGFAKLTLGAKPPVTVALDPIEPATRPATRSVAGATTTPELTIAPGQTISAWLSCDRDTHKGLISFDVQNLPHGVIVADIGLSGVLIPADESRRQIFLTCAAWVPEQDRLCFARAREAGNPTSAPVLLHVRKPVQQAAAPK
jgi:WD40 repeat protein/mono/diheme cytochrome c family protein